MLITTPLRNPRDGCVPMPITSMPVGVISPTMQQILVVPMSRPTTISPFFCDMGWLPLVREGCGGLVGTRRIVELDPRGHLATPGQRRALGPTPFLVEDVHRLFAELRQRRRMVLFDVDHQRVGKSAREERRLRPGVRLHGARHARQIDAEEIFSQDEAAAPDQLALL